jgi:L-alanine-DL-glutamate epimerase-like enolase superfamily enzyme
LKWLEKPACPPENYDRLAGGPRKGGIAIAARENVSTLTDFDRLLAAEAVDYVQPSPAKTEGASELRRLFTMAAVQNVAVLPHTFYDSAGLLAGLHATAPSDRPSRRLSGVTSILKPASMTTSPRRRIVTS